MKLKHKKITESFLFLSVRGHKKGTDSKKCEKKEKKTTLNLSNSKRELRNVLMEKYRRIKQKKKKENRWWDSFSLDFVHEIISNVSGYGTICV